MLSIKRTKDFERSVSRLMQAGVSQKVITDFEHIIESLQHQKTLDKRYRDHALHGQYQGYRECHIRHDLLLIYQIRTHELILVLVDVGTHSYLFGG